MWHQGLGMAMLHSAQHAQFLGQELFFLGRTQSPPHSRFFSAPLLLLLMVVASPKW